MPDAFRKSLDRGNHSTQINMSANGTAATKLRSVSPGTWSSHSQDSCHSSLENPEEKGDLDVRVVTRDTLRRENSAQMAQMKCYKMDARPRGLALIIEIEEYDNNVQEKRIGSKVRTGIDPHQEEF